MDPEQIPLRDLHLPEAIGWWPLAPGWWLLIALGVVLLAYLLFLHLGSRFGDCSAFFGFHPLD